MKSVSIIIKLLVSEDGMYHVFGTENSYDESIFY
jgi:hypothetical protein